MGNQELESAVTGFEEMWRDCTEELMASHSYTEKLEAERDRLISDRARLIARTKQRAAFLKLIADRLPPKLQDMVQESLYSEVASDESLLRELETL